MGEALRGAGAKAGSGKERNRKNRRNRKDPGDSEDREDLVENAGRGDEAACVRVRDVHIPDMGKRGGISR